MNEWPFFFWGGGKTNFRALLFRPYLAEGLKVDTAIFSLSQRLDSLIVLYAQVVVSRNKEKKRKEKKLSEY